MAAKKTATKEQETEFLEQATGQEAPVAVEKIEIDNSFGPNTFLRDSHGLLTNVQYHFNIDGSVNWRAMINPEHIYVNKDRFPEGKTPDSIEGLDDSKLLIKLSGIKEIAKLRGFSSVHFNVIKADEDHATVSCSIDWLPNYETGDMTTYMDVANATLNNCDGFSAKFLEAIAANRAFIRCVRNFLNIHIVGADEIDKSNKPALERDSTPAIAPQDVLAKIARVKGFEDYESFKVGFLKELYEAGSYEYKTPEGGKKWESFKDIPAKEARILLALLNMGKN